MAGIKEMMIRFDGDRRLAVIRHAKRPDIISLENERDLSITKEGYAAAVKFGKEIGVSDSTLQFQIFSWGSRRVIETAEAITIGLKQAKRNAIGPSQIFFASPMKNSKEYERAFYSGHWNEFIENWMNGKNPQTAFYPVEEYAKTTYRSLLDEKYCTTGKVTIIVTHDLHIMPLIKYAFPSFCCWLKYLDGIVLKDDGDKINVGFDGMNATITRESLGNPSSK